MGILKQISEYIRDECKLQIHYFSFNYVPDMLVKKKINKKDFALISKLLIKVKKAYLVHKKTLMPDKKLEEITITEDDLVPLMLIDNVLSQIEHKFEQKKKLWEDLVEKAKVEVAK